MVAEKPIDICEEYRKIAMQGEPILDYSQKLVIISMENYKEYTNLAKEKHNAEYMAELDRRSKRLDMGEGVHKTLEELEAMEHG